MQCPDCLSADFYIVVYLHLTNRIAVRSLGGVSRFRCEVPNLLRLFFAMTPWKRGKSVMIRPCQVADYWSLHLLDFDWLKLYGSSAGFD